MMNPVPAWPAAVPAAPGTQAASYTHTMNPAYTPVPVRQNFGVSPYYPQTSAAAAYSLPITYGASPQANPPPTVSPPQAVNQDQQEPMKKKIDWPESVRNYVQRSFLPNNMDSTVSRAEMEAKLKDVISRANDMGYMYTIDWNAMALPQEMIKDDRRRAVAQQTPQINTNQRDFYPAGSATTSKKRKSTDAVDDESPGPGTPPWRGNHQSRGSLEGRISFAPSADKSSPSDDSGHKMSKFQKQLEKRQKRFDGGYKSTYRSLSPPPSAGPVVGTCENLEKRYLRLTAPPVPSAVRPERILRQTLELLKKKWRKEQNYSYICDQFKSMRQDLTVQRIKNDFTVSVYEIHARIALEKGDLGEYNQCQTQLKALYQLGLKGNPMEFKAYRILYFIHTANRVALNDALADLTTTEKKDRAIKHALDVRSALALGNYHRFFQLYLDTPNMGAYLIDMFVGRERLAALCNICKAYKPDVRLRFVTEELGFESDADAAQFIINHNGQHLLEERNEDIAILTGKAGGIFEELKTAAFRRVDIKGQI